MRGGPIAFDFCRVCLCLCGDAFGLWFLRPLPQNLEIDTPRVRGQGRIDRTTMPRPIRGGHTHTHTHAELRIEPAIKQSQISPGVCVGGGGHAIIMIRNHSSSSPHLQPCFFFNSLLHTARRRCPKAHCPSNPPNPSTNPRPTVNLRNNQPSSRWVRASKRSKTWWLACTSAFRRVRTCSSPRTFLCVLCYCWWWCWWWCEW
jgi:hypothetical protein